MSESRGCGRLWLVLVGIVGGLLLFASGASAAVFNVTTTADTNDGTCGSPCSLRDAVIASNQAATTAAANTINTINVPAGTYKITRTPSGGNEPAAGSFDLVQHNLLTVNGAGAGSTVIDANHLDRAFAAPNHSALTLNGLTIQNGLPNLSDGVNSSGNGGGVYSDGPLQLNGVTMTGNSANSYNGGAIYLDSHAGSFAVDSSEFTKDSAGGGYSGGAIYFNPTSGTLGTISRSSFSHDTGYYGAGIYINQGSLTVTGSSFDRDNSYYGGGIYASSGDLSATLTITNDSFSYDNGYYAGAIYWDDYNSSTPYPTLTITGSKFTNSTAYYGGALYLSATSQGPINISSSSFLNNSSSYYAGAIYFNYGALSIDKSTIANNQSAYYGGGLYLNNSTPVSIVNSTISGNASGYYGGGVYISSASPLTMLNDTVAFNQAPYGYGGGIAYPYDASSGSVFQNLIVANNSGGDCGDGTISDLGTSSTFNDNNSNTYDHGNNLDSDGSCIGNDAGGGAVNNIKGVDPLLAALADNGGPTMTHALMPGSPALDAANTGACPSTDQRGVARKLDANCDIGAYESVTPSQQPPSILGIAAVGQTVTCSPGAWAGSPPLSYGYQFNRDGVAIPGATSANYAVTSADAGHTLTCTVTDNTSDGSISATSAGVAVPALPASPGSGGPASPSAPLASLVRLLVRNGIIVLPRNSRTFGVPIQNLNRIQVTGSAVLTIPRVGNTRVRISAFNATTAFSVPAGATKKLFFTLSKKAAKTVRRMGRVPISIQLNLTGASTNAASVTGHYLLVAQRKAKKPHHISKKKKK